MKVLIVDDNKVVASVVEAILTRENYRVQTAEDGEIGYAAYLQFEPDLVITDIEMPRKDGFSLMKDIRSHNPGIRTIYMSANVDLFRSQLRNEESRHSIEVLNKPFTRKELLTLLSDQRA
jgi:CheY-like chemotaxis protein